MRRLKIVLLLKSFQRDESVETGLLKYYGPLWGCRFLVQILFFFFFFFGSKGMKVETMITIFHIYIPMSWLLVHFIHFIMQIHPPLTHKISLTLRHINLPFTKMISTVIKPYYLLSLISLQEIHQSPLFQQSPLTTP